MSWLYLDISVESPQHDHTNHTRQKQHDHKGVHDAKPMNFGVRHRFQNIIPTRRPLVSTNLKIDIIRVDYLHFLIIHLESECSIHLSHDSFPPSSLCFTLVGTIFAERSLDPCSTPSSPGWYLIVMDTWLKT